MFEPLNIFLRGLLAIIFLLGATKLLTKRNLSHITYFDSVAASLLGTISGNLAFNLKVNILNFIFSIILVTVIISFISYGSLKSTAFRRFIAGEPTIIIDNGKILEKNMEKLKYSFDYLNQQLRQQGVFDISQVDFAILEASGNLSVKLKSQNEPLTPRDINLSVENEGLATELILDGKVIDKNLKIRNLSIEWLMDELNKKGAKDICEVAFAALATNGNLYVDFYCDNIRKY